MAKGKGKGKAESGDHVQVVARNKEARRRWDVDETFEAGIVLTGTEAKALREGHVQIADAYAIPKGEELLLVNLHIGPYGPAGPYFQHEPRRTRKLLLHKAQILRLLGQITQKGYSLVPLDVHFRNGWAKVQIGLARGKKVEDRREDIKRRTAEREMERHLK